MLLQLAAVSGKFHRIADHCVEEAVEVAVAGRPVRAERTRSLRTLAETSCPDNLHCRVNLHAPIISHGGSSDDNTLISAGCSFKTETRKSKAILLYDNGGTQHTMPSMQDALAYLTASTVRHVHPFVPSGAPPKHSPATGVENQCPLPADTPNQLAPPPL